MLVPLLSYSIQSKKSMNVLRVQFDSKLTWSIHVATCISKAKKSLFAIRLLKKYFHANELRTLLDSYFYSVLYYNANIWLTPDLKSSLKHDLLLISANALRVCMHNSCEISFERLHVLNKKCTPNQIMFYQFYNVDELGLNFETITLIDQMIFTSRQLNFQILRNNKRRIGLNTTANKFYQLNNKISLNRFNLKFVHFKKIAKIQFLI